MWNVSSNWKDFFAVAPFHAYTALPNLVTELLKHAKSSDFWEGRVSFGVWFCEETVCVLLVFCQDFEEKAWQRLEKTAKVRYCLQEEILFDVFTLFFPKHRVYTCFEDGCPQLTLCTSHRCAKYSFVKALSAKNLRHCYLCFRKVSCPVSGLINGESAIISHFLP